MACREDPMLSRAEEGLDPVDSPAHSDFKIQRSESTRRFERSWAAVDFALPIEAEIFRTT